MLFWLLMFSTPVHPLCSSWCAIISLIRSGIPPPQHALTFFCTTRTKLPWGPSVLWPDLLPLKQSNTRTKQPWILFPTGILIRFLNVMIMIMMSTFRGMIMATLWSREPLHWRTRPVFFKCYSEFQGYREERWGHFLFLSLQRPDVTRKKNASAVPGSFNRVLYTTWCLSWWSACSCSSNKSFLMAFNSLELVCVWVWCFSTQH